MLILLPPSEGKRGGGDPTHALHLESLAFPELTGVRRELLAELVSLCQDDDRAVRTLALGPRQHGDVLANRLVEESPTLPAIQRYTGVVYDGLDYATLSPAAVERLRDRVIIQSALFGPIRAFDPIPYYRMSAGSRVGDARLRRRFAQAAGRALVDTGELLVDVRSRAYMACAPLPEGAHAVHVEFVIRSADGGLRPAGHHNKRLKGLLVRALLNTPMAGPDDLSAAADAVGAEFTWIDRTEAAVVAESTVFGV